MHLQQFYILPCFNHWRQVNMKMPVCVGHCQRLMDAGLLARRMARSVKCEGSYTCDRFGPSQPQEQLYTHIRTFLIAMWHVWHGCLSHWSSAIKRQLVWITPHNSLHGTGNVRTLYRATDRGIPSEWTTRFSRLFSMSMWRSCKQKQAARAVLRHELTIYRSLH